MNAALPLRSDRLVLRRFLGKDAEAFLRYRNDPEVARYQSWTDCSAAEAEEFIRRQESLPEFAAGEWFQLAIALKPNNELIGDCGTRIQKPEAQQATIGVTLGRAHQGRGFATEALSCLFDHLFRIRKLHRIVIDTDVENIAMQRLAERLGMRRKGHLRQSLWFKGRWADEFCYAILRDEWSARDKARRKSLKTA